MSQGTQVLLVQPPFLRLVGSHNDRAPLELCYLHGYLRRAGIASQVLNADWTGASRYIRWSRLFQNFALFASAVDGCSPLYDETIERIVSFDPDVVVLSAGDNLTPWVDLGNAYFAAQLSTRLRSFGVYTVGLGPCLSAVPHRFTSQFDSILVGTCSPSIVDVVRIRPSQSVVHGTPMDLSQVPLVNDALPGSRADVVVTAAGCPHHCSFCFASSTPYRPLPLDTVRADVAQRSAGLIDIGDSILPLNATRIVELARLVSGLDKAFTCEVSVRSVTRANLDALRQLGVVLVKLGMESADSEMLAGTQKPHTVDDIMKAADLIKEYGFGLLVYVLLGGPLCTSAAMERTLVLCQSLQADDYVVNTLAYYDLETRDFRYDSHFSQSLAETWGLVDMLPKFFDLQSKDKVGLGALL